jgi:hypothetical protein
LNDEALRNVCVELVQHIVVTPAPQRGIASWTLTSSIRMAPMNPKYIEPTM